MRSDTTMSFNPMDNARYLGRVRAETEIEEGECTCTGPNPADPCGHGDVADGCPVHDPNHEAGDYCRVHPDELMAECECDFGAEACEDCGEEAGNHSADCFTYDTGDDLR